MLGYYKDKKVFVQGDLIENQIRRAVSKSGGTIQHYNMFNHLINYSIWNETLEAPIHDTRAAQCLLFIFPPAIRIFLSLVLYKEELNIERQ